MMVEWLLRSIGIGDEMLAHLDKVELAFQRPVLLAVGLVFLGPAAYYVHHRQRTNLVTVSPGLRGALTAMRIFVLTVLLLILSGPYFRLDHRIERRPIVAMVLDHSQSMQLPAGPFVDEDEMRMAASAAGVADDPVSPEVAAKLARNSRSSLAQAAIHAARTKLTAPLAERFHVRFHSMAAGGPDLLQPLEVDPARPDLPEPPSPGGPDTPIGDAMARILDEAAGRPVAGILLFSDGQNTGGSTLTQAGRAAALAGAPVYAVPAGSRRRFQDVALVDVFTSEQVSLGDTAQVSVTIESQGFDGRTVPVQILDGQTILDSKDLTLRGSEQQQLTLEFVAKQPGPRYLTVRIPPLEEEIEALRANNSDLAFLRVSDEKIRLLYVEGWPRWDFRFLKNSVRRDHGLAGRHGEVPDIVLEAEARPRPGSLTSTGRQSPASADPKLPTTLDELAEYHTLILGDVSFDFLSGPLVDLVAQAVRDRGLGLIVAAGPRAMPHGYPPQFQELLPIRLRAGAAGVEAPASKPFRIEVTPDGMIHEAMRLYDEPERNQSIWRRMPPFYWCVNALRPAPAATVLAWNATLEGDYGKLPLIGHHYAGQGKVVLVGTDSTWRWRQNVGDRYFYKFWGQVIRFAARRVDDQAKKNRIEVRPIRARPGEEAIIELLAYGPQGGPRTDRTRTITIARDGSADPLELGADPATKGRYSGRFVPGAPGRYRVTYEPDDGSESAEVSLQVSAGPQELRHPNVDRSALEGLARATGGRLVELADLDTIPPLLKGEPTFVPLRRDATIWDNWLTLLLLAAVYSVDVGLRRLAGLS